MWTRRANFNATRPGSIDSLGMTSGIRHEICRANANQFIRLALCERSSAASRISGMHIAGNQTIRFLGWKMGCICKIEAGPESRDQPYRKALPWLWYTRELDATERQFRR